MKIKAVSFDPLVYEVDGMPAPLSELTYKDENDMERSLSYLVINGEKVPIKHEAALIPKLASSKLDDALVKVEEERVKKIEDKRIEDEKKADELANPVPVDPRTL